MATRARAGRGTDDLAARTADQLHSAAIHLLRRVRREDRSTGIAAPGLSALSVIVFSGPIALSDLAHAEQVRPPTMTRLVRALESAGLVERLPDPGDRRVVRVRATRTGARVLDDGRRRRVEALARELRALAPGALRTLGDAVQILERVVGPRQPTPNTGRTRTP